MRPPSIKTTRSATSRANCIAWVTITIVIFCAARSLMTCSTRLSAGIGAETNGTMLTCEATSALAVENISPTPMANASDVS